MRCGIETHSISSSFDDLSNTMTAHLAEPLPIGAAIDAKGTLDHYSS
jgi:hypothetical protein